MFIVAWEHSDQPRTFVRSSHEMVQAIPAAERFASREAASAEIATVSHTLHLDTAGEFVIYPRLVWDNPNEPIPAQA